MGRTGSLTNKKQKKAVVKTTRRVGSVSSTTQSLPTTVPLEPEQMTSTTLLKFSSASSFARNTKQTTGTQRQYKGKIGKIARFLYDNHDAENSQNDLRSYTTRLSSIQNEDEDLVTEQKEVINGVKSTYWLKINVPLPKSVWELVFGMLSTDPRLAKRKGEDAEEILNDPKDAMDIPTMSTASMRLYKSAIKWYHEKCRKAFIAAPESNAENNEEVTSMETLDDAWEAMIKGYEKIIAGKKERGIMSVTEGESILLFLIIRFS